MHNSITLPLQNQEHTIIFKYTLSWAIKRARSNNFKDRFKSLSSNNFFYYSLKSGLGFFVTLAQPKLLIPILLESTWSLIWAGL